jgi:hypothetical protein
MVRPWRAPDSLSSSRRVEPLNAPNIISPKATWDIPAFWNFATHRAFGHPAPRKMNEGRAIERAINHPGVRNFLRWHAPLHPLLQDLEDRGTGQSVRLAKPAWPRQFPGPLDLGSGLAMSRDRSPSSGGRFLSHRECSSSQREHKPHESQRQRAVPYAALGTPAV